MLPRFLVPDLDPDRADAVLPPDEAHHLTRVLRLKTGDDVAVFDGRGCEFRARVRSAGRGAVTVSLLEPLPRPPHPAVTLSLVQSVLKPDLMDDVIRDCTMIGVNAIQPVLSARTTVKAALLPKAVERWGRIALASAKQCGRSTLPRIAAPLAFDEWLRRQSGPDAFLLVEPSAASADVLRVGELVRRPRLREATVIVGPEGGWTTGERDTATAAACTPLSLGPLTLRADAVALAAAAILLAVWDP